MLGTVNIDIKSWQVWTLEIVMEEDWKNEDELVQFIGYCDTAVVKTPGVGVIS